ncbi:hypothetical protein V6N13_030662 [Hibiscus sabdariffa]
MLVFAGRNSYEGKTFGRDHVEAGQIEEQCRWGSIGRSQGVLRNVFDYEDSVIGQNFILICWKIMKSEFKCVLINVHGPNESGEKIAFLNKLSSRVNDFNMPIIMVGDFNLVRIPEQRIGVGSNRAEMENFSEFIDSLGLVDISLRGGCFTWSNFRDRPSPFGQIPHICKDSESLAGSFSSHVTKSLSDLNPIFLSIMSTNWGPRPFKWFDHLLDDNSYVKWIDQECCNANGIGIGNLLRKCKTISKELSLTKGRNSAVFISELEKGCLELEKKIEDGNMDPYHCKNLKRMYVCCPEVWVWSLIALTQLVLHPSAADIHTTGGVVIAATVHNSREYLALLSFKFGYVFMVVG